MRWVALKGMLRASYILGIMLLLGCESTKPKAPALDPSFYGIWTNANASYYNWWDISAKGAVNYGIALDAGTCVGRSAVVLALDRIDIPFGNSGSVQLRLSASGFLVFEADRGRALHKPVEASDICRKPDGTYFVGALHAVHQN